MAVTATEGGEAERRAASRSWRHLAWLRRFGVLHLLCAASLVVLAATVSVGWYTTERYNELFLEAKERELQRLLDSEIAARLWRAQFALIGEVAQEITQNEAIKHAFVEGDRAALQ